MDIDVLLWLQQVREGSPAFIEAFFTFLGSDVAMMSFMLVPCIVYWCLDKRRGMLGFMSYGFGLVTNGLLKCTVCCYRPWVRDARVIPDAVAVKGATGYSFPSGHTQAAASMIGGLGWAYREKRWPLAAAIAVSLLVGFSRVFLGVHTPQDVIVGLLEGFAFIFICERLMRWVDEQKGRDLVLVLVCLAFTVLFLAYATFKPYPMDYVDGVLLVDPAEMIVDCYKSGGAFVGLMLGWYVERTYLDFACQGISRGEGAVRLLVGLLTALVLYVPLGHGLVSLLGNNMGQLLRFCLLFFAVVAGVPALFGWLGGFFRKEA